jgi:UrcA family protein
MRSIIFALAAVCAFAAITAPAAARESDHQGIRVVYRDLDINTERGADRLLRRINRAAERVCGYDRHYIALAVRQEYRHCIRDATDSAVAKTNNASVLARYQERTGRTPQTTIAFLDRS